MHGIPVPITAPSKKAPGAPGGAFPYNSTKRDEPTARVGVVAKGGPAAGVAAASTADNNDAQQARKISSQRLNPNKCSNPFQTNTKRCKSTFSQSYISGSIPCRLHTTASRYHLHWDQGAESGFSPDLLVVCADGLCETDHPYVVLAPMMFSELVLRAEGCLDMFVPVMEPITTNIRKAMLAPETFDAALSAYSLFLQYTGHLMTPHLTKLIPCLAKHYHDKKKRDAVANVLGLLEQTCGQEATKLIKSKIPTY